MLMIYSDVAQRVAGYIYSLVVMSYDQKKRFGKKLSYRYVRQVCLIFTLDIRIFAY